MKRKVTFVVFFLWHAALAQPDAVGTIRAMKATTIAEIFIEPDAIRVELEIGRSDLVAFQNLLPDDIREGLGLPAKPRLGTLSAGDLAFRDDRGAPLSGRVLQVEARRRVPRDEVTGAPLPASDNEGEPVLYAKLSYPLAFRPKALTITPPRTDAGAPAAEIGFMTYHRGLSVNDFRYLGQDETVRLDWEDPWFSKFDNRNLWRQYDSPISAFLYVEHNEVRKEIVIRPKDLERWVDLGLRGKEVITVDEQAEVKRKAVEFLRNRNPVRINGEQAEGTVDRVHFIFRNLRTSGVVDPPRDLDVISATLGVIFYYPVDSLPDEVTMEWELWDDDIESIPSSSTDEAGALPYRLSRDDAALTWQNVLKNPERPGLVDIDAPPAVPRRWLFGLAIFAIPLVAIVILQRGKRVPAATPLIAVVGLTAVASVTLVQAVRPSYVARERGDAILVGLLENVYRSFDYRDESVIYDALEQSASGELLTDIYLETRRSLELENQGGARANVKDVSIVESRHEPLGNTTGFVSTCRWTVTGSVGHWGHVHQRTNQYRARLVVEAIDGRWKITELELLEEERSRSAPSSSRNDAGRLPSDSTHERSGGSTRGSRRPGSRPS